MNESVFYPLAQYRSNKNQKTHEEIISKVFHESYHDQIEVSDQTKIILGKATKAIENMRDALLTISEEINHKDFQTKIKSAVVMLEQAEEEIAYVEANSYGLEQAGGPANTKRYERGKHGVASGPTRVNREIPDMNKGGKKGEWDFGDGGPESGKKTPANKGNHGVNGKPHIQRTMSYKESEESKSFDNEKLNKKAKKMKKEMPEEYEACKSHAEKKGYKMTRSYFMKYLMDKGKISKKDMDELYTEAEKSELTAHDIGQDLMPRNQDFKTVQGKRVLSFIQELVQTFSVDPSPSSIGKIERAIEKFKEFAAFGDDKKESEEKETEEEMEKKDDEDKNNKSEPEIETGEES